MPESELTTPGLTWNAVRICGLLVVGALQSGCGTNQTDGQEAAKEAPPPEVAQQQPAPLEEQKIELDNWSYDSSTDELRGRKIHTATVTSENSASFSFPYQGQNYLRIQVRKHPEWGTDVILIMDKGQILCHSYSEPCRGMVSFDGKVQKFSFNEAADNSSNVVFVSNANSFIKKLKGSSKLIIELPFYQEGNSQFKFETKGLVWPPKG